MTKQFGFTLEGARKAARDFFESQNGYMIVRRPDHTYGFMPSAGNEDLNPGYVFSDGTEVVDMVKGVA